MERYDISRLFFLVITAVFLLACSQVGNKVKRKYIISKEENEREIVTTYKNSNVDLYIALINIADSLLQISDGDRIVDADTVQLEILSNEVKSIEGGELNLTSYYLIVDYFSGRQFYWGINIDKEETIYFTNPDGNKTLKLVTKTNNGGVSSYNKILDYVNSKYLKAPPMPPPPLGTDTLN